jgi:hypothetical protein
MPIVFERRRLSNLSASTVVSNRRAMEKSVSPRCTRYVTGAAVRAAEADSDALRAAELADAGSPTG